MKNLILPLALLLSASSNAQSTTNAGEYLDYFSVEYTKIQKDSWDYTKSVSHGRSARKVEKKRMELIQSANAALNKSKRAKGFEDNTAYRDSVVQYFELLGKVLREDYADIVDMEEIAEQSYDLMEAYLTAREQAGDKMQAANEMINREQRTFAEGHNITIIEDDSELGKKMEIADQVYDHYNDVYLIFFKSYKQELYLLEAIERKDVSAIEQNRNALIETTEEGLSKLGDLELFENDNSMIEATEHLLEFYADEAKKDVDITLSFLEENENFAKVKAALDKKKEKDRTQEDVDQYNNGVNAVNKAVNEYNEMNERSNKDRSAAIDKWNVTADRFTSKHVPKGK